MVVPINLPYILWKYRLQWVTVPTILKYNGQLLPYWSILIHVEWINGQLLPYWSILTHVKWQINGQLLPYWSILIHVKWQINGQLLPYWSILILVEWLMNVSPALSYQEVIPKYHPHWFFHMLETNSMLTMRCFYYSENWKFYLLCDHMHVPLLCLVLFTCQYLWRFFYTSVQTNIKWISAFQTYGILTTKIRRELKRCELNPES
jgi:hypothetical protein